MINMMSVDVEDWFQVHNLTQVISYRQWDLLELRVKTNTARILQLLDKHHTKATFFVLGWLAERLPQLVQDIAGEGHEIACHGYSHRLLTSMTPGELDAELTNTLAILRQTSGQPVTGFRAPSFSVTRRTLWSYEIMAKHGIQYDSSVFPIGFHPDYGIRHAPLAAYRATDAIVEVPLSCAQVLGGRVPCSGGGYFRILPYAVTRHLMQRCNSEGRPVVFYVHPWEFDPGQPRMHLPGFKQIRHYTNLHRTTTRFDRLLSDFDFGSIQENLLLTPRHADPSPMAGRPTRPVPKAQVFPRPSPVLAARP